MRIVLVGASGHGKVCAEIAELAGYGEVVPKQIFYKVASWRCRRAA